MFSQEIPFVLNQSALLFIDVQNYAAHRQGGEFKALSDTEFEESYGYFFRELRLSTLPNMQRLQAACRAANMDDSVSPVTTLNMSTMEARSAVATGLTLHGRVHHFL